MLTNRLILASASPRRLELLRSVGIEPEVVVADVDEGRLPAEQPLAYTTRLAAKKASAVLDALGPRAAGRVILGADTTVVPPEGDEVFGKPRGGAEARAMLARLAGKTHLVISAFHLLAPGGARGRAVCTQVTFRPLGDGELTGYVASGEWEGKAGGYAIQGLASAFVRTINGSYASIVGLPVCEVVEDLAALGVLTDDFPLGRGE